MKHLRLSLLFSVLIATPSLAADHRAEEGPVSGVPMAFPDAEWEVVAPGRQMIDGERLRQAIAGLKEDIGRLKDDPIPEFVREDWLRQYREHYGATDKTGRVRMHFARNSSQAAQALRPLDEQALIWETDRDPADAALRRTEALLERLAALPVAPERIRGVRERLAEVRAQVQAAQRGEHLSCQGCHEHKHRALPPLSSPSVPLAMRRTPSRLKPELPEGVVPAGFYHLVKHSTVAKTCVACHVEHGKGPRSIEYEQLAGAYPKGDGYGDWLKNERWIFQIWVMPYNTDKVFGYRSTPGHLGASASRLWRHVMRPEAKKRFSAEDLRRLGLWLDFNSNEFGAGHSFEEQRTGKVVWPKHMDPAKVLEE
jgi:hypothetical protein